MAQVQATAEEENADPVVFEAAEAAGCALDGLDAAVEALTEGVGDAVGEVEPVLWRQLIDSQRINYAKKRAWQP